MTTSRQLAKPNSAARPAGATLQRACACGKHTAAGGECAECMQKREQGLLQRATFGVSLEPSGGSPTGRPTSPALHAKLLPVAR